MTRTCPRCGKRHAAVSASDIYCSTSHSRAERRERQDHYARRRLDALAADTIARIAGMSYREALAEGWTAADHRVARCIVGA